MTNPSPDNVDLIIHARWIIPVEPADTILEHHGIAIRDGKILAISHSDEISANFRSDNVTDLADHALIPGLRQCDIGKIRGRTLQDHPVV